MKQLVFALLLIALPAFAFERKLTSAVNDFAGVLTPSTRAALTSKIAELQKKSTSAVVVDVVQSLDGVPIEKAADDIFKTSGIGQRGRDNGVLFLVALNERQMRIEVGYGLEGWLTDARCREITSTVIKPLLKAGKIEEGIVAGVDAIASTAGRGDVAADLKSRRRTNDDRNSDGLPMVIVVVSLLGALLMVLIVYAIWRRRMRAAEEASRARLDEIKRDSYNNYAYENPYWHGARPYVSTYEPQRSASRVVREVSASQQFSASSESSYASAPSTPDPTTSPSVDTSSLFDGGSSGGGGTTDSY